ncbi:MAG TPA: LLM class flavin-dependent oxidoreductase [Acidimicrobiales bacterium]|nr:LLM class flavin-dependent oxidoreductase [Acidimicrobiales bacterium]
MLRFGTGTTVRDFGDYRRWLEVADGAGFDLLSTGDSQSLWADCYASMMFAATLTSRPALAVTVSNPMTRHPAVAASAAAAVQQVSGGRFALGLASGDSALRNIGVRPSTVAELEAYAVAVRELTAGRACEWHGQRLELHWLGSPTRVRVWLAAEGPATQRLAGRIADGVVLSNCLTRERLDAALANVAEGAAEVGRSPEEVEVWCMCNLVFAASEDEGIDSIASVLAGTANHVFRFTLEGKGIPEELKDRVRGLMGEYQSRFHAQPGVANPNNALIEKYGLRAYLAAQGTVAGPPSHCVERLRQIEANGVRNVILSQFVDDPLAWMRTCAEEVLPAFR